ncbi:hypothetical protein Anapl_08971 [Anas platyrhynchos]|uniref:Uncharacterized protein n=1 Tax=Anas platyrhynchos TaxID=8839 RepID=R0M0B3_ANAPL|nr:hypothetical protein Anapl_08971 [Anas platyrhynchos]
MGTRPSGFSREAPLTFRSRGNAELPQRNCKKDVTAPSASHAESRTAKHSAKRQEDEGSRKGERSSNNSNCLLHCSYTNSFKENKIEVRLQDIWNNFVKVEHLQTGFCTPTATTSLGLRPQPASSWFIPVQPPILLNLDKDKRKYIRGKLTSTYYEAPPDAHYRNIKLLFSVTSKLFQSCLSLVNTTELSSVSTARADSCVALNAAPLTLMNTTALRHCLHLLDKQIHLVPCPCQSGTTLLVMTTGPHDKPHGIHAEPTKARVTQRNPLQLTALEAPVRQISSPGLIRAQKTGQTLPCTHELKADKSPGGHFQKADLCCKICFGTSRCSTRERPEKTPQTTATCGKAVTPARSPSPPSCCWETAAGTGSSTRLWAASAARCCPQGAPLVLLPQTAEDFDITRLLATDSGKQSWDIKQYSLHILFKHSKQEELPLLARENPFSSFMRSNVTGLGEPSICISSVSGTQWNCCTADAVGGGKGGKKEATIPPVSRTSIRQQAPARQRTAKPELYGEGEKRNLAVMNTQPLMRVGQNTQLCKMSLLKFLAVCSAHQLVSGPPTPQHRYEHPADTACTTRDFLFPSTWETQVNSINPVKSVVAFQKSSSKSCSWQAAVPMGVGWVHLTASDIVGNLRKRLRTHGDICHLAHITVPALRCPSWAWEQSSSAGLLSTIEGDWSQLWHIEKPHTNSNPSSQITASSTQRMRLPNIYKEFTPGYFSYLLKYLEQFTDLQQNVHKQQSSCSEDPKTLSEASENGEFSLNHVKLSLWSPPMLYACLMPLSGNFAAYSKAHSKRILANSGLHEERQKEEIYKPPPPRQKLPGQLPLHAPC